MCSNTYNLLFSIPGEDLVFPRHSMANAMCQHYQDVLMHPVTFCNMQPSMLFISCYRQQRMYKGSKEGQNSRCNIMMKYYVKIVCIQLCRAAAAHTKSTWFFWIFLAALHIIVFINFLGLTEQKC